MGVNVVTDLRIFQETCNEIKNNESLVQEACSRSLSEAERKLEETQQELAHSNQLLQEAIAEEQRRLAIMQDAKQKFRQRQRGFLKRRHGMPKPKGVWRLLLRNTKRL